MSGHQFELAQNPEDIISAVKFAPDSIERLLVSSWDKNVYLYNIQDGPGGKLLETFSYSAAVLDVCFGRNENEAFFAAVDGNVVKLDLQTSEQTFLSSHKAGVRNVIFAPQHELLVSGSWDSTLHVHNLKTGAEHSIVHLPAKSFSLSVSPTKLVVGMSNRAVNVYELDALASAPPGEAAVEPYQQRESSMKYMTRAVACMPSDAGYASSSIEGRVAVEWFDPSEQSQSRKYAFKCHRQTVDDEDLVYPVNALLFHPKHNTFATGGGDGVVALWDAINKRRIRQYQKFPASVSTMAFSDNGKFLAVGVSPGFETGKEGQIDDGVVKVYIRELADNEAIGKAKKEK